MNTQSQERLSGNFRMDVARGIFHVDESDPDYEEMYRTVESFNLRGDDGKRLDVGEQPEQG